MKAVNKTFLFLLLLLGIGNTMWAQAFVRFAFIIGANDGGSGKVKLQYAVSDAQSVAKVLVDLGGVKKSDIMFLADPSPSQVINGLNEMSKKILAAKPNYNRVEVVFYYSGHSDEKGLLLKGDLLSYGKLKSMIQDMPADVRIAILDSCAS
jgi:hypothetical protein